MKRPKKGTGGANWMDTYGDMVTLLLCFFVLLYSMSNISEEKWAAIVQSFRRNAPPIIVGVEGKGGDLPNATEKLPNPTPEEPQDLVTQEDVQNAMTEIYESLNQYAMQNNLQSQVSVVEGSDYVFITFKDTVFFEGDSYTLLEPGQRMLDQVAAAIEPQKDLIDELRIMGHTSQGDPNKPNNPINDRFLASNRSATVLVYLQNKNILNPAKLVNIGYGQWRSIAPFDSEENRAKNRRVEILITGVNVDSMTDSIDEYYETREGQS